MNDEVLSQEYWEKQYQSSGLPWETNRPSSELQRVISDCHIQPCRAVEFGCGTGDDAVWLASRGFEVTAVDLSSEAIDQARGLARAAGVSVNFIVADVTAPGVFSDKYDFFYDCGSYTAVHLDDGPAYRHAIERTCRPGALGLVLMGNALEPGGEDGPTVLEEWQVRAEWSQGFDIVSLRSFRFDARREGEARYLGWSCLLRGASQDR